MKMAVAFLNVLSKGAFIMYLARIRTDYNTRQKTLVSVGYIKELDGKKENDDEKSKTGDEVDEVERITILLIKDVLESMGRSKDKDNVVALLQSHLITTNNDILALTKEYCSEIELPWGLVIALKSKIRSYNVQLDDPWSMQVNPKQTEVTFSAPHIARNAKKINTVARRQSSKETDIRDDMSDMASRNLGYPSSSFSDTHSTFSRDSRGGPSIATPRSSHSPSRYGETPTQNSISFGDNQTDEMKALFTEHQKTVNVQVDECRKFVEFSMDKILGVIEQKLVTASPPHAATPGFAHANIPPAAAPSAA
jgi:hypothetical protein